MSHDTLIPIDTQKPRVITKARVIAGLLAEMDAAAAIVIIETHETQGSASTGIRCEFRIPFEESHLKISSQTVSPGSYSVAALFAGQRITFSLKVLDERGNCAFPSSLTIIDLRRSRRRSFGPSIQTAEIYCRNSVTFATPIDFSQNSMALVSAVTDPPLQKGDQVEIKIRGDTLSRDIYSFNMTVHDIEKSRSATRILLGFREDLARPSHQDMRSTPRHPLDAVTISIAPIDGHVGDDFTCRVSNISLTGLRCEIQDKSKPSWFTPGLHVQLQHSAVHATIMWRHDDAIGLRLDALDDSRTLGSWIELLRKLAPSHSLHHSQVDELVGLFTESGLLKGARRKVFGTKPGKFLPSELVTSNPLLFHRVACTLDDSRISGQVSMVRLTDDFWFLQEGTHSGHQESPSYDALLREIHKNAQDLSATTALAPRYVGGLVHKSVKSSVNYLEEFMADPANARFDMFQISISSYFKQSQPAATHINRLGSLTSIERRNALDHFTPIICDVFAGLNGCHPRLNAELAKLGPTHKADTVTLGTDQSVWGLGYRLKSYYSLSSTGVVNSLFLVIRAGTELPIVREGVHKLLATNMVQGTDDLVFIIDPHKDRHGESTKQYLDQITIEFPSCKSFALYVIDSLGNKKRL